MQTPSPKRLGPLIITYRDRPLGWSDLFLIFLPASLAALSPLIYGLIRNWYARTRYGPAAAQPWSWQWYALSALALIPLLILALKWIRSAQRMVHVHKNGLRIQETRGRSRTLSWDEINGLACATIQDRFLGLRLGAGHRVNLYPTGHAPIPIAPQISGLDELAARIKAKIYPRLLPEMRASLQAGRDLDFGPVTLKSEGLSLRDEVIPWGQIANIDLQTGFLVVELSQSKAQKISVEEIPNIELLIQLIQEGVEA